MRNAVTEIHPITRVQKSFQVGAIVAAGRKARGKSQKTFAAELGIGRKALSNFERGVTQNISLQTALRALALAGLVVSIRQHRAPTLTEILAMRAAEVTPVDRSGFPG